MMTTTPLFAIDRDGWIMICDSVKDLEEYAEPIDVDQGEYRVFDAEGRLLRLGVMRPDRRWQANLW
jgi:hypothetical protein